MTDWGNCSCCDQHGLTVPADHPDGLCSKCRSRSPSACQRRRAREGASK